MSAKRRVLLVDDNEADNVYHEIILRRCDLVGEVQMLESAAAALQYLQASNTWPDLMLVDVNMPGMDGFTLIRELEKLAPPATCKLALLTSSDAEQDRDHANRLKLISAYIIKPLALPDALRLLVE